MHPNTIQYLRNRERFGKQQTKIPAIKAAKMIQKGWRAFSRYLDSLGSGGWLDGKPISEKKWRTINYDLIKNHNSYHMSTKYQREKAERLKEKNKIKPRITRSKRKRDVESNKPDPMYTWQWNL